MEAVSSSGHQHRPAPSTHRPCGAPHEQRERERRERERLEEREGEEEQRMEGREAKKRERERDGYSCPSVYTLGFPVSLFAPFFLIQAG